jgi:hypothetical protein
MAKDPEPTSNKNPHMVSTQYLTQAFLGRAFPDRFFFSVWPAEARSLARIYLFTFIQSEEGPIQLPPDYMNSPMFEKPQDITSVALFFPMAPSGFASVGQFGFFLVSQLQSGSPLDRLGIMQIPVIRDSGYQQQQGGEALLVGTGGLRTGRSSVAQLQQAYQPYPLQLRFSLPDWTRIDGSSVTGKVLLCQGG